MLPNANCPDPIKCLDHGFVRLVDVMGDDQAIVQAARISVAGEGVRKVSEDRGLIRYLMRMRHTTPFEMVEFKFHVKVPIFIERQWIRHRMASTNEMSARYSELPECYYVPEPSDVQYQAATNKQGRAGEAMDNAPQHAASFAQEAGDAFCNYKVRLGDDMARELARINLPLSTYTEKYWKVDLKNLLDFLGLRMDKHAQYEIRVFANAMATLIRPFIPITWEAFEDFKMNAVTFSAVELRALQQVMADCVRRGATAAEGTPYATPIQSAVEKMVEWPTSRELEEFRAKLDRLLTV